MAEKGCRKWQPVDRSSVLGCYKEDEELVQIECLRVATVAALRLCMSFTCPWSEKWQPSGPNPFCFAAAAQNPFKRQK
ncbi:hypothetical protein DPMN_117094 [Dreissena polymorpha]|uniref:Uncharacterized protein n=1 Tax=Dreissena polymorpha TaxID=45954 RepID=A0A9D4KQ08_DREPO|nr:hypothetical protein DPMN_117094 [Dreissena polymorpha]